ncbi:hypothetical protein EIP91_009883 [Steccherinum ochraceum]|uniref:Wings apart-like protein C-terminal domain-containing protein n=1 Tax=Steccherinum ochraceum TaxID=92696 RepID=A0A4V2MX50_9APHY|nr:hypothetical protein EIP91_009883 [Steccherinum ochraceum]
MSSRHARSGAPSTRYSESKEKQLGPPRSVLCSSFTQSPYILLSLAFLFSRHLSVFLTYRLLTGMQRTYSRRHRRQSKVAEPLSDTSPERSLSPPRRKRRKVEVEATQISPNGHDIEVEGSISVHRPSRTLQESASFRATPPKSLRELRQSTSGPSERPPPSRDSRHTRTRSIPNSVTSSTSRPARDITASSSRHHAASPLPSLSVDKPVKDLASLFDFSEPLQNAPSKPVSKSGGIAKRMLRRAKTDPSVTLSNQEESQPGPSTPPRKVTRTDTQLIHDTPPNAIASLPSTPSKSASLEDAIRPPLVAASSNMRTYGGKSRSFLVALGPSGSEVLDGNNEEDDFAVHESYNELRARWGVDNSEDDPYPEPVVTASPGDKSKRKGKGKQVQTPTVHLPSNMMNDLKSITELRSKGESRRFLDDVGYLFEGLEASSPLNVRRGSALEIVTKFCDDEFSRKAKAADFLPRTWEGLRGAGGGKGDKVLDTILIFFVALVARDPRDLPELATADDLAPTLFNLLASYSRSNDPLWLISSGLSDAELKRIGVAKADKTLLSGIHTMILDKSGIFEQPPHLSNRLLLTFVLSSLQPHLLSSAHFNILLEEFLTETENLPSRVSSYATGLPLHPSLSSSSYTQAFSLQHIEQCLRLLDSYLLGRWTEPDEITPLKFKELDPEADTPVPSRLVVICAVAVMTSHDQQMLELHQTAYRCMESSLRVLINLTHDSVPWSQVVTEDPLAMPTFVRILVTSHRERMALTVKKEEDEMDENDITAQLLDRLCLALGLITNLIQNDRTAHVALKELQLDPACKVKPGCSTSCQCPSRVSGLDCLASVYLEFCKLTTELDVVVRGHIAILFGLLMKSSSEVRRLLLDKLPGATNKKKLASLVDNAREFALFYVEFAKKASAAAAAEGREEDGGDEEHLLAQDADMRKMLRDSQGESVARDVLEFLTGLRDQTRS